ncbi:MAG: AAA family ATPase, partial [Desulfovibrionaceae bacterium]|nr:AAA family ATPase [Desulfovibrionaceae bacterium]
MLNSVKFLKKEREIVARIKDFIFNSANKKIAVVYGLRQTGKTTAMLQAIYDLAKSEQEKAVFVTYKKIDNSNFQYLLPATLMLLLDRINELNNLGFKYFFVDNITSLGYFFEDFEEFIAQVNKLNFKLIISGNESSFFTDFLNKLYVIDSTKMSMKEFHYLFNDISEDCIINNFGRTVFNDEYDSDYEGIIKSYGYNFQNYVNSKDYKFVSPSIQLKAEENRLYFYVTKVVRYHAYRIIVDAINKEYYDPYKLQEIINNDINRIKVKAIHLDQNVTILDWLVYRHYLEHCEYINGLTLDHRFEKMPLNI